MCEGGYKYSNNYWKRFILVKKNKIMAKIYHKEFKKKLDKKNEILWSNEPKHENKYKTNQKEKRLYFKKELNSIIDNTIIKKCDRSYDICAIKYGPKNNTNETTLVLQEYSKDEGELIITWEFLLYDRLTDAYVDSRFFSDSKNAFAYFIDKTLNMIDN